MSSPNLAIVVPCYNEEAVLEETVRRLTPLLEEMSSSQGLVSSDSYILLVNDGSSDSTWSIIQRLFSENKFVCGVNLAGNVGHQNALMAGMETAKDHCDILVSIDADLQDDIHAIPEMVKKFSEGNDIVYGVRKNRDTDTWFKRTTALAFYKLMKFLGVKSVYNHADFRLMSKRAVEQLCRYREKNLFLRGIVPIIGYRSACVFYDRSERFAGESKYPLGKMLSFAIDGITSFSVKPVRFIFSAGLFFLLIALGIFVYIIISLVSGTTVSGWTSLILSLWFIGGCGMLGIGIIGEYIGKIYLEVKDRPRYIIESTLLKQE
jgi:glycosyltransferase involved in cell wall biosynthesis